MGLKQKIKEDLNIAFKGKREIEKSTLRMLSASIINNEKEKRGELVKSGLASEELENKSQLEEEEIVKVVFSEIKKRKEAIHEYEKAGKQDLAEKEKKEAEILQRYLPEQLSEEEIEKLAKEVIDKIGATDIREMGKVMKELIPKIGNEAEGKVVSRIVREILSSN